MKTILVPTDFSENSENAQDYAIELAKITKAKIVLLHAYQPVVVPSEVPIIIPTEELEENTMTELHKIGKEIHQKHGNQLTIEYASRCGFPAEEIQLFAEKNNVDLIVMGVERTDNITEKMIGNITSAVIKKAKCPVLAIDKHVKFTEIKKIALACDYEETKNSVILGPLTEFSKFFDAHIYVLNVTQEMETITTVKKAAQGIKLNHSLEKLNHSFHYTMNDDVIEGINSFVDKMGIDMVVMIPRIHSALHNLFHEPNSKRMAFHTKVPLLALHE